MRAGSVSWYGNRQYWDDYVSRTLSPFGVSYLLRAVCWLNVTVPVRITADGTYRFYWRIGINNRSRLCSPTVSVAPANEEFADVIETKSRVATDPQIAALIQDEASDAPMIVYNELDNTDDHSAQAERLLDDDGDAMYQMRELLIDDVHVYGCDE